MTGTGTQADPYIVDNWSDFITAAGTSGAYVEFPKNLVITSDTEIVEGKLYVDSTGEPITNPVAEHLSDYYENTFVLDQNDYAPEGLTSNILIYCTSLNGYGGMINNIYFQTNGVYIITSKNTTIRNINFNNWLNRDSGYCIAGGLKLIHKCILSASLEHTKTIFGGSSGSNPGSRIINNCSVYVKTTADNVNPTVFGSSIGQGNFNRVMLDCGTGTTTIYKQANSLVQGATGGSITFTGSYSVIDCNIAGNVSGNSANSQCIVNSDKVSGTISSATSVTTEQLKDAEYLASLGFPIQT